jgi:hypothetical protein
MTSVAAMNLTGSAKAGIRELGISKGQALAVIQRLTDSEFSKPMPSTRNPGTWQDVYKTSFLATGLYVKFSHNEELGEYVVVSFKEDESA